jgi:hypothetical protein
MTDGITIRAEDDLTREQGNARLIVEGLSGVDITNISAQNTQYWIRRSGFTEPNLSAHGWQVAEVALQPIATEVDGDNVVLVVGPNIVEVIEPYSTFSFSVQLPGMSDVAETTLLWPDITPPIMRKGSDDKSLGDAGGRAAEITRHKEEADRQASEEVKAEEQAKQAARLSELEEERLENEIKIAAAKLALEEEKALAEAEEITKEEKDVVEPEVTTSSSAPIAAYSKSKKSKKVWLFIGGALAAVLILNFIVYSQNDAVLLKKQQEWNYRTGTWR